MNARSKHLGFLVLLALVFTIGLTFASIELPRLMDTFLARNIDTPDIVTGQDLQSDQKTGLYLRYTHLRLAGYICLALIVLMIAAGFITEKSGWTSAGALFLFLPVFGHFAATMFFLGGLGFLRLLWLPLLDVSFRLFRLGEIVTWPYKILADLYALTGLGRWVELPLLITGTGLFIFFLGTLSWFYARTREKRVADFGVYRFSRHPQYLGWIVWSYGIMFLPRLGNIKLDYELSDSLPWLLATMIIIGVAMLEEVKMSRAFGDAYESYRRGAPFLFPLPRFLAKFSALPLRLMFKKPYPERKREIVAVLAFYAALLLGISAIYGGLVPRREARPSPSMRTIEDLARVLKDAGDRGEKRRAAGLLAEIGEPAMEPLLALLGDRDPNVRAYSAGALGTIDSERVVSPLIALLRDGDPYVRRTAAEALGRTGSSRAVDPLIAALEDPAGDMASAAARALGRIKHPDVVPHLIEVLRRPEWKAVDAAAQALGELGAQEAVEPLIGCFEADPNCPYHIVGRALWKLGSERAVDAWITGLKKGSWWYPRADCAAALGKNKLEKGLPPLQEALKDESPEVRRAAVLALMEFRSESTVGSLREALADKDLEVRIYAREALKRIVTLESVLRKYVEALGGKAAIEKIRGRRLSGELIHEYPGREPPRTVLPAEVIAEAGGRWRLVLTTAKGIQQMGFDGTSGWSQDADRVLVDNRQARSKMAYLFNPQGALRVEDYFMPLSLKGEVVSDGRKEYAVQAQGRGGAPETLYFDAETGLLNRLGENVAIKAYRRTARALHPVHIAIAREGGTSTYRFDDISVNAAVDDGRFAIPKLGEVFPDVFEGLDDPAVVPLLKDFPSVHEDMNVPARDGRFLYDLIIRNNYKRGLEIGSFTGYSALWLGLAFKATGGRLVTIEFDPASGEQARANVRRAGLEGVVDARIADAFTEIPKIAGQFDFVFVDAWKPDYVKFLALIRDRVVPGGVIVGHNVTNYARDMRDYLAAIGQDPGLETTFHELSAEGISVSKVRIKGDRP
jgi:HEAT repeat protein/predicted O-methyltransferase YrrM/protein-S-isoprenylcysteine O-methyltransferase Ste14